MKKLKIAIQKSGRLNTDSLTLLNKCGIKIDNYKTIGLHSDSIRRYAYTKNAAIANTKTSMP